jgi:hypothetical protein
MLRTDDTVTGTTGFFLGEHHRFDSFLVKVFKHDRRLPGYWALLVTVTFSLH